MSDDTDLLYEFHEDGADDEIAHLRARVAELERKNTALAEVTILGAEHVRADERAKCVRAINKIKGPADFSIEWQLAYLRGCQDAVRTIEVMPC